MRRGLRFTLTVTHEVHLLQPPPRNPWACHVGIISALLPMLLFLCAAPASAAVCIVIDYAARIRSTPARCWRQPMRHRCAEAGSQMLRCRTPCRSTADGVDPKVTDTCRRAAIAFAGCPVNIPAAWVVVRVDFASPAFVLWNPQRDSADHVPSCRTWSLGTKKSGTWTRSSRHEKW